MNPVYLPRYAQSWAISIGIDRYASVGPLQHACNDARGVANVLIDKFSFRPENVSILCNDNATKDGVLRALLGLAETAGQDDRVVFFFAGHGDTRAGRRGDVGYLVPHGGDPSKLETLIRWDELTRNADLIPAKHMLFLMDACYGGLALTRGLRAGSMRFAKDMLSRYSRQVLTAGKPDETVADGGGPRTGHSLFTAHLLDALDGRAAGPDGILTAGNVTAYVYERVGKDQGSAQSPHYGHLDGDGDLIFNPPELSESPGPDVADKAHEDILIQIPAVADRAGDDPFQRLVKQYLSDPKHRIDLDDLVTSELKIFLHETREQNLSVNAPYPSAETIVQRLQDYENASARLLILLVLIARWGDGSCRPLLARALARMTDNNELRGGTVLWLNLRWYPLYRMIYAITVASIAAGQFENLYSAFTASVGDHAGQNAKQVLSATYDRLYESIDAFKLLSGHDRAFVPLSEYLFKNLQAPIEDLLFLGRSYEQVFDRTEILLALSYADLDGSSWYPSGRFSWKHKRRNRDGNSPLTTFFAEATAMQSQWPPLRAGFFGGSQEQLGRHEVAMRKGVDEFPAF
jgi:uncharacterized caspase-like protein